MLRASAFASRRVVGTSVAVVAAAGIGLGAYSLGSASGASTPQGSPVALEVPATPPPTGAKAAPAAPTAPSPAAPTTASPLTLDQAKAVAVRAVPVPGRVVEWDTDQEPTGLRYDVTLLHADGTSTDVEVDAATGRVTGIDHHDDRD